MNLTGLPKIYERLFKYARRLVDSDDKALDFASAAYVETYERAGQMSEVEGIAYACVALRNLYLAEKRSRSYAAAYVEERIEWIEGHTRATQENYVFVCEVLAAVNGLSVRQKECLKLAALELKPDEIKEISKLSHAEVVNALGVGRKKLRTITETVVRKKIPGVRRNGKKYEAYYTTGKTMKYVGLYSTEGQAVLARAAAIARVAA